MLKIIKLDMHTDRYEPIRGSGHVSLPEWIARKKAVVNIENQDNLCSLYAVQSAHMNSVSTNPAF